MPVPFVKEEAKKHHQSVGEAEKAWEKAKSIVEHEKTKPGNKWAEVTDIFKNIEHDKK